MIHRSAQLTDLCGPDLPWPDPVSPEALVKAIRRLSAKLLKLESPISVSIKNKIVVLDRPPDR